MQKAIYAILFLGILGLIALNILFSSNVAPEPSLAETIAFLVFGGAMFITLRFFGKDSERSVFVGSLLFVVVDLAWYIQALIYQHVTHSISSEQFEVDFFLGSAPMFIFTAVAFISPAVVVISWEKKHKRSNEFKDEVIGTSRLSAFLRRFHAGLLLFIGGIVLLVAWSLATSIIMRIKNDPCWSFDHEGYFILTAFVASTISPFFAGKGTLKQKFTLSLVAFSSVIVLAVILAFVDLFYITGLAPAFCDAPGHV